MCLCGTFWGTSQLISMCELSQELLNCGPNPDVVNTCGADMFQYVSDVAQWFLYPEEQTTCEIQL